MKSYRATAEIEARPDRVFPFLVEPERLRTWIGGFVESRPLTDGGPRLGAKSVDVFEENGRRVEFRVEIRCYEPPRRVVVAIDAPFLEAESDYLLEARGEATTVAHHQQVRYKGLLRLLAPFLGGITTRRLASDLARLRAAVEAERRLSRE